MARLVLSNARLIDGTGSEPRVGVTVVVEGHRIAAVGDQLNPPLGATVLDMTGLTVMPGLIDCHLHLAGFVIDQPGRAIGKIKLGDMIPFMWDYFRSFARRRQLALENGVTTIRSAGDNYPHIIQLRDKIGAGKLRGPLILAAGPTFTAPGGHPVATIYKNNRYIIDHATRQVADLNVAREEVKRLAAGGVDCIKAIYSRINPMAVTEEVPQLNRDVLVAIIDEAHRHKLRVMVHTGNAVSTREAVAAGADSIEHGILPGESPVDFSDEVVRLMVERETYFVPTLAIAWAYQQQYPDVFTNAKRAVNRLHNAGVRIALGTDSGTPGVVIGRGVHQELALLVEAGLSNRDAILAGTRNAAGNLGWEAELGTITSGKLADIIAIAGDPLTDIAASRNIRLVIKGGAVITNKLIR